MSWSLPSAFLVLYLGSFGRAYTNSVEYGVLVLLPLVMVVLIIFYALFGLVY